MVLISRLSRLFRADLHAVLDRIEEPELLLRQAIREMDDLLVQDEQRSRLMQQQQKQLSVRQNQLEQELNRIEEKLGVCFRSNEEELARKLIRRRLETRQLCRHLTEKRNTLEEGIDELRGQLEQNRVRLDSMRQRAELLISGDKGQRPEEDWSMPDHRVADEDVEVAFLHEKQQRSQT